MTDEQRRSVALEYLKGFDRGGDGLCGTRISKTLQKRSVFHQIENGALRLLEKGDIDTWIELWAEDAGHYYPYGTAMFPRHLHGKQAIYDNWSLPLAITTRRAG
ncbi:nuclear transport factor 2-like protein [Actinomadura algeriensis]|uniref:Uncharacterized protein n=1 Tax=Actinomadura algeriensis TaxID=1679523 RepID=A0ABR9JQ55_9ACTN|nr:hypothetical protein [Actinomadura algeriensis]MBE1532618.1 hypothetical protein [Actinomadura algeriensis]